MHSITTTGQTLPILAAMLVRDILLNINIVLLLTTTAVRILLYTIKTTFPETDAVHRILTILLTILLLFVRLTTTRILLLIIIRIAISTILDSTIRIRTTTRLIPLKTEGRRGKAARKRKPTEITAVHFTLRMCGTRRYEQLEMTRSWRIYYWRGITLGITLVSFEKIEEENLKQRRKRKRRRRVALRVKRKRFSSRQVKYGFSITW
tara:strand:+ start:183 stop:803 length:621 start_codon:yes stop_codon:yes gene_type:complete